MTLKAQKTSDARSTTISGYVRDIQERGGLKGPDIAQLAGVSNPTVSRWRNSQAEPRAEEEQLIANLKYVIDRLDEYYEPNEIRLWLNSPHPQLDGESAINVIRAGRIVEVLNIIKRLDDAGYL